MKKSKFTKTQILFALPSSVQGISVDEVCKLVLIFAGCRGENISLAQRV